MNLLPTFFLFFFNDTATTEIYTLSLHDALPICSRSFGRGGRCVAVGSDAVSENSIQEIHIVWCCSSMYLHGATSIDKVSDGCARGSIKCCGQVTILKFGDH